VWKEEWMKLALVEAAQAKASIECAEGGRASRSN
jgi:hypothetical protein